MLKLNMTDVCNKIKQYISNWVKHVQAPYQFLC